MQPQSLDHVKYSRVSRDGNDFDGGETSSLQSFVSKIMPLFKRAVVALTVVSICYAYSPRGVALSPPICSENDLTVLSCTAQANETDSCCVENPGGLLLSTQLYNPLRGPADTWTIHGLWGDFCNGSYPASCDSSRNYEDIPSILNDYGQDQLVDYMSNMWLNDPPITTTNGSDADLWAHEWSKHGTCMSTLRPQCYENYSRGQELVDFFTSAVLLAQSLPTFQFLDACGIRPSANTTYALADVENCLAQSVGDYVPHVGCSADGSLNEVWYYFHWVGRIKDGSVVGTDSTYPSKCPQTGIKYLPKVGSSYT